MWQQKLQGILNFGLPTTSCQSHIIGHSRSQGQQDSRQTNTIYLSMWHLIALHSTAWTWEIVIHQSHYYDDLHPALQSRSPILQIVYSLAESLKCCWRKLEIDLYSSSAQWITHTSLYPCLCVFPSTPILGMAIWLSLAIQTSANRMCPESW